MIYKVKVASKQTEPFGVFQKHFARRGRPKGQHRARFQEAFDVALIGSVDLSRFRSGQALLLGGPLFESHG